ncbi:zinc-binding dehydrogenase, partial [Streptomyces sp. T-3]|nr:zinc-binding dehydrogenase [Streptomyces sp. T-3]
MHAIRLHAFGPAENLTYEKTEAPEPGPGQVRIAVKAAGVHLLDTAIREGMQGPLPQLPELPTIPGREVAGVVDALGEGTDPAWLGKRVVTHLGFAPGGYAELAVVGAERLHEIPERLDEAAAVAMIGTGRTTMGILNFVELGPDSVVVVPAAAGGIGSLIVQYAKHVGATVIGLAGGPAKVALVEEYGADLVLDYKDPNWAALAGEFLAETERRATVVFDGVGGDVARAAIDLLGPGGTHVVFGWTAEGIESGGGAVYSEEEFAARGVTSVPVLGPAMMAKAGGGDNPVRTLEL